MKEQNETNLKTLPPSIKFLKDEIEGCRIKIKWFSGLHWFGIILLVISSIPFLYILFYDSDPNLEDLLGLGAFVLISFLYSLYGIVNSRVIHISKTILTVSHKPLPWFGKSSHLISEIENVEFSPIQVRTRFGNETWFPISLRKKNNHVDKLFTAHSEKTATAIVDLISQNLSK